MAVIAVIFITLFDLAGGGSVIPSFLGGLTGIAVVLLINALYISKKKQRID
ncbi:hypothetical protein FLK61_40095 [Paenalkalicoccus suaedae]|uniref:Uncharacterized protein n=1 Tax=Paenalkalicoccus suaedae TaxID=2592382 RepID=A0A859FIY5_9BACI|nr:hypothetical protein [Paenalkalicoccus suaedae]QKS72814.1 hypothetical protein FLK61_40095 [Paenalkalicoccus suaedae]